MCKELKLCFVLPASTIHTDREVNCGCSCWWVSKCVNLQAANTTRPSWVSTDLHFKCNNSGSYPARETWLSAFDLWCNRKPAAVLGATSLLSTLKALPLYPHSSQRLHHVISDAQLLSDRIWACGGRQ